MCKFYLFYLFYLFEIILTHYPMLVEIKNLSRYFNTVRAVDDVSFSFGDGEVIGFVGPNGAGKTTTMRIMATLDEPTAGDVLVAGKSVLDYPEEARRHIGFMPDALPEHSDITAHEYVDFFARAYGLRAAALAKAVADVEEFTGLGPIRDKPIKALSKGMKQRVGLARALVHDPGLLIMDEPANGLDPRARIELRELVKILAERGKTILVSSHILPELAEMCTGIVILERGRLLSDGTAGGRASSRAVSSSPILTPVSRRVRVRAAGIEPAELVLRLLETPGILNAMPRNDGAVAEVEGGDDEASTILAALFAQGLKIIEFRTETLDLEDVFMTVTKGNLQ